MTFRHKLQLAFALMIIPTLLIGAEAIRSNILQRRAQEALGVSMSRTRTYAELETAMFNQSEIVWRYLSGMDPTARKEFNVTSEVIAYWQARWRASLAPDEISLANDVDTIQSQIHAVALRVFALYDSGHHEQAYLVARSNLRDRLLPALTELNRYIYQRARESSVQGAYSRLEQILAGETRILVGIVILALVAALAAAWLIAESLARPLSELRAAMAVVGAGNLDHPIAADAPDEVGDLARAFVAMSGSVRESRADLERVNAELEGKVDQLERTQAQLVQSERLATIGQTAAAVAHGLRNPLASLRAAAQVALRHPGSAASREYLAAIIGEVDRLDRRVSHLLSFSRPAPFRPLPEQVGQLVEGLLPSLANLLPERGVTLDLALAPALPDVRVDPMQLEQALLEIITNAVDAMPNGGRLHIATRAEERADGGAVVLIEIGDTGGGIPDALLASVCEPFFTTRPEGTGLGLAIAKRYVEQNGGHLEITSTPGTGTVMCVVLPAAPPDAAGARPAAADADDGAGEDTPAAADPVGKST